MSKLKNYISTINKLSELKYIFNAKKLSAEQARTGIHTFFKTNHSDIWNIGNSKGFFNNLKLKNGMKVSNAADFKKYLDEVDGSDKLFDFVEVI